MIVLIEEIAIAILFEDNSANQQLRAIGVDLFL